MQVINYLLAVAAAAILVSARKLHWSVRGLAILSFFVFYHYGVLARNYMLATLLLTGAARCLLGERKHNKAAILLLALAINTHYLAIPVAATLALWAFGFAKLDGWKDVHRLIQERDFVIALPVLLASTLAAYITVRPPADMFNWDFNSHHYSLIYNFLIEEGNAWETFIRVPLNAVPLAWRELIAPSDHASVEASLLSLVLFLIIVYSLRARHARWFFTAASLFVLIAMAAIPLPPLARYQGVLFVVFMISLLIDAYGPSNNPGRWWLGRPAAFSFVLMILGLQTMAAAWVSLRASAHPESDAKAVSSWLKQQNLDRNPMLIDAQGGYTVVGYLQRSLVYDLPMFWFSPSVGFDIPS